jgi:hypothetical protein
MHPLIKSCGRDIRVQGRLLRIACLDADKYQFVDDPEPVLDGLRKCGTRVDLFTFMQKLPETAPKFRYPMEPDNLAVLAVSTFDHWWTKQVDAKTRNMVRKAEKKGVVVREVAFDDALVKGIWEIYNETPVRQGKPNSHYGKDIRTVYAEEATFPESSVFIGAYFNDSLIGFARLVQDGTGTQAGMMNIVSMVCHRDKAPTNALVAHAVRCCADWGIPYLVYAGFTYGKKQQDTLADFKRNNGFQQIDLPRYYVPLTPLGSLAFRLGLHHKLADRLPEPVAAKLRDLRKSWYNRKFSVRNERLFEG